MTEYVLDTNVYVRAARDADARAEMREFRRRVRTRIALHGVVALELRAGARSAAQASEVNALIAEFAGADQVTGVSFAAYAEAGRVLAELVAREGRILAGDPSLFRDVVLATSCREHGLTLVTENAGDFAAIARHLRGFRFAAPFP